MKAASLALLPLLLLACAAAPEEDSPTGSADEELVNARVDTKNTWSIGICAGETNTDAAKGPLGACADSAARCSGALIAPNLVLTAQHCVRHVDYEAAKNFCDGTFTKPLGRNVRVTLERSVLAQNPAWIDVSEIIAPGTDLSCQNDLVVLRLAKPVSAKAATPIRLDLRPLKASHPKKVAIVGRGLITAQIDPVKRTPINQAEGGLLRRFKTDVPFDCVSDGINPCSVFDLSTPPENAFDLPPKAYFSFGAGTSSGDSGAAILSSTSFAAGRPVAIGVNSAGTFGRDGLGNYGLGVRLDTHKAFILATLEANDVPVKSVVCDETKGCD